MTGFRGSDEALDREIAALEKIARVRVRRVAADLADLEKDLRVLRKERARRRASDVTRVEVTEPARAEGTAAGDG